MSKSITTVSPTFETFISPDLRHEGDDHTRVWSRQRDLAGWDQEKVWRSSVLHVGSGGLGGEILHCLVKKGYARLITVDGDTVSLPNLNRQRFYPLDLGHDKPIALASNLSRDGCMGTEITGYPFYFEEALERGIDFRVDVVVCGVDSDRTRGAVAEWAIAERIPAVFSAVSRDGDQCYCLVQSVDQACFGCIKPDAITNEITPCPGVPAIIDSLKLAAALASYAVDSLLMNRPISWNYRESRLAGFMQELVTSVARNPDCPLCGRVREDVSS